MGLGLYVRAEVVRTGLLRRMPKMEALFHKIERSVRDALPDELLRNFIEAECSGNTLHVFLHPAEEPVEFSFNGDSLVCSAKTNSAGPGFHAFLVELLEQIAPQCGLEWQWAAEEEGDDTGYYQQRNFSDLQEQMIIWLQRVAQDIVTSEDYRHVAISLPLNYTVEGEYCVISSMGYWSRDWFKEIVDTPASELSAHGDQFFPWWDKEMGARFWLNCGCVKAWVDLPWHAPQDHTELERYNLALACFDRARSLDPAIALPESEIKEIRELISRNDPALRPAESGLGFKRKLMRRPITGDWTITIPGYYYDDLEDEDGTAVYWFDGRSIRGSSITVAGIEGRAAIAEEMLGDRDQTGVILNMKEKHLQGHAQLLSPDEVGESYWKLTGRTAMTNYLCIVTICFDDPNDREWAIDTWHTVFRPAAD